MCHSPRQTNRRSTPLWFVHTSNHVEGVEGTRGRRLSSHILVYHSEPATWTNVFPPLPADVMCLGVCSHHGKSWSVPNCLTNCFYRCHVLRSCLKCLWRALDEMIRSLHSPLLNPVQNTTIFLSASKQALLPPSCREEKSSRYYGELCFYSKSFLIEILTYFPRVPVPSTLTAK